MRAALVSLLALSLAAPLSAQSVPIPLNYNFSGIVHQGWCSAGSWAGCRCRRRRRSASNAPGFFALGFAPPAPLPLAAVLPSCTATLQPANPLIVGVPVSAGGRSQIAFPTPPNPAFCGAQVVVQFFEFIGGSCPLRFSDGSFARLGN